MISIPQRTEGPSKLSRLHKSLPAFKPYEMIAGQTWPDQVPPWTALRRLGEPDDIADVVAFLASDDAHWLTGLTIAANGGLVTTAANILARAG